MGKSVYNGQYIELFAFTCDVAGDRRCENNAARILTQCEPRNLLRLNVYVRISYVQRVSFRDRALLLVGYIQTAIHVMLSTTAIWSFFFIAVQHGVSCLLRICYLDKIM